MDKKTYLIGILAVIATILFAANLLPIPEPRADAAFSIKDNRYQVITTRSTRGGEVLYVVDNLTGQVAVMGWENNQIKPLTIDTLTNLFR